MTNNINSTNSAEKFGQEKSLFIWGIISLVMVVGFAYAGFFSHNFFGKEFYSWILLILMFTTCGIKMLVEYYNNIFLVDEGGIKSLKILGNGIEILWKDVTAVELVKVKSSIVVKSQEQRITIPLKTKDWDLLLEMLEDEVAEEKFIGFE